jgi:hypothetical protein
MAKRISQLTALTSASLDTTLLGIDRGVSYKIELDVLADAVKDRINTLDDIRLDSLENFTASYTASVVSIGTISGSSQLTSSLDARYTLSGSIANVNTSSLVNRLNAIENVSSSWITESETGSFLTSLNGAISSSEQVLGGSGIYSSSAQIQGNIYSAGSSFTFQDLLLGAGTTFGKITTDGSKYISVMPTYNVESTRFWPNGNVTIQDGGNYVDNGFKLEVSGSTKIIGSFNATDGITGSTNFDTIVNKPTLISGSSQLTSSFDERYVLSGSVVSGTTPAGTISGSSQLTSSFDSRYVLETETGSLQTSITSLNIWTSSAATTGSNSFNGNQTITGSLVVSSIAVVTGGITIPTGSTITLTSGSNLYVQNNGLVEITGSLNATSITGSIAATNGVISGSSQLTTSFPSKTTGTWTIPAGASTQSFTVDWNHSYQMWVNGNIPNGIITWNATVNVTNANVAVVGSQYAWYYPEGNALVLTSIPTQIVGVNGVISTTAISTTTSNTFVFGITNNSGAPQTINYGYIKIS